jgi:predicted Zn-dependent protease
MAAVLRNLCLVLAALAATSCGRDPGDYVPQVLPEEQAQAAAQHPQLLAEFGGAYEGPEAAYVETIGEKLAAAAGLSHQCRFTLVNTDVVNAFAVPGCYIYVTRGLFGIVNSEAELASVIGHEIGHIVAAHSRRQQRRQLLSGIGAYAIGVLTGSDRLARLAARTGELFTLRYSRQQEFESDELGIRYLRAAGYDPYAAADMLQSLGRHDQFEAATRGYDAKTLPAWARTHPLAEERITRAAGEAEATGVARGALPEREAPFMAEVDGLLYGDDPVQGFVIGRRFAHPVMGVTFEAPQGYSLTNTPAAVLIDGRDGARGQFGGSPLPAEGLEAYAGLVMEQLLGGASRSAVQVGQVQRVVVNGLPSIVVPATVRTEQGDAEVTVAAFAKGREAYHFITVAPAGKGTADAITRLVASFRLLSPEEIRSLRPRRIQVVRAAAGETPASLAGRMAVSGYALQHFLMLNDRDANRPLKPGEEVKIVSYAPR